MALAVVVVAMALPWASTVIASSATGASPALRGFQVGPGQLVILAALASIAVIELGWRPAWMGAGLVVAVLGREFIALTDTKTVATSDAVTTYSGSGAAIYVGMAAGVSALIILIWHMFSEVAANAPGTGDEVSA